VAGCGRGLFETGGDVPAGCGRAPSETGGAETRDGLSCPDADVSLCGLPGIAAPTDCLDSPELLSLPAPGEDAPASGGAEMLPEFAEFAVFLVPVCTLSCRVTVLWLSVLEVLFVT
jgi:hypothetical protein